LGKDDEAIPSFDHAIALNDKIPDVWFNRGVSFMNEGDNANALRSFDQELKNNPTHVKSWVNKGVILVRQQRLEESLQSFERALSIDASNAPAIEGKCKVLKALGRPLPSTCDGVH
ncbi:MAG: tetratricopeptide repeat protein, partial [Candidatus Acidiferrales bacterium]